MKYGKKYEVTTFGDTEIVFYRGTRFSKNFNFGKGAEVCVFEREADGSMFECLPEYVEFSEVSV